MRFRRTTTRPADGSFAGTEVELTAMTRDLEAIHHEVSLPRLHQAVGEWTEHVRTSRRGFLVGAGAVAGGALLAACSSGAVGSSKAVGSPHATSSPATLTGDLAVAGLAASLENLAVGAYDAGIRAATAGKLGTVPPAVVTFATTARSQHAQHGQAWNSILTAAGHKAITAPDPVLGPMITQQLGHVHDVVGLAKLALSLEDVAAATYQAGIGSLSSTSAVKVAASIQPVELQHAAILLFALGQYPVPNAFSPTSGARPVSDLKG